MTQLTEITVKGAKTLPQYGTQVSVYCKGVDTYENIRIGKEITILNDDGNKVSGTLSVKRVGALLELLGEFGANNLHTFGQTYSPVSLVQALSDSFGEDPLDVTKLYTVLVVQVVPPATAMPGAI